jgi:TM2 domain-containing membrane protein YozV
VALILWILAVILVIAGIVAIVRGQILWGIVLIIVGLLVGPGGVSIFDNDDDAATMGTESPPSASVAGPS